MSGTSDIERLRRLSGVKWSRYGDDVLPAWVADMDLLTAPPVTEALRALIDTGDLGYNMASFDGRVERAWARWSERRFSWRPDIGRVRLFGDVLQAIAAVLVTATQPGDGVVLFTPIYPPFFGLITGEGRRVLEYRLEGPDWRLDAGRLESIIDDMTRAVILCNPHNPTGRVLDDDELDAVAHVAEQRDLLVISDEIWQDVVYPGAAHVPFASRSDEALRRTVTVTSASKSFNLGGLNCAVGHVGSPSVLEAIEALPPHLLGHVNALGAHAAVAAWSEGDSWLDATVALLRENRDRVVRRLRDEMPDVRVTVPEATYLAWLDFRGIGLETDPAEYLLDAARVALSPGPEFGAAGEGFARLNFATSAEILEEILDRVVGAVARHAEGQVS